MTTSDYNTADTAFNAVPAASGRNKWSGINIAGMVLGFVLFWPVGLIVLGWILSGRDVRDLFVLVKDKVAHVMPFRGGRSGLGAFDMDFRSHSDNVVFDEYQQTQHDRIQEIKDEISERSKRFGDFRAAAKRRADKEEFEQFMNDVPAST